MQQVDIDATVLTSADVDTNISLDKVNKQVAQDIKDLPAAIEANQISGTEEGLQNAAIVSKLLKISVVSSAAPTQTQAQQADTTSAAAEATATSDSGRGNGNGRGHRGNNNNNQNANNNNNKRSAKPFMA